VLYLCAMYPVLFMVVYGNNRFIYAAKFGYPSQIYSLLRGLFSKAIFDRMLEEQLM
jgi:hypothetical protein